MTETGDIDPARPDRRSFAFSFVPEPGDLAALHEARQKVFRRASLLTRGERRIYAIAFYGLPAMIGIVAAWLVGEGLVSGTSVVFFIAGGFVLYLANNVYAALFHRRLHTRALIVLDGLAGKPVGMTVDEQGLTMRGPYGTATYEWQAVRRVDERPDQWLLWIGGLTGVVIPRRAFSDQAEAAAFAAAIKEWWSDQVS